MRVFDSSKTLVFVLLLLASTLVVHAVVPKGIPAVKGIVVTTNGDSFEAQITTTSPGRVTYFELTGPRRLVVDFHDLQNAVGFKEKIVREGGVERIRASLFTSKDRNATRIVFDLTDAAHYEVINDKSQLVRVVFGEPGAKVHPAIAEPPSRTEPGAVPVPVPTFQAAPALIAEIPEPQMISMTPKLNLVALALTAQDVSAPQVSPVLMLASAAPAVPIFSAAPVTTAPAPMPAPRPQISTAPATAPGSSLSAPPQTTQYTGELVSFDVRDLEFKDFFRLISETSGINIVTDLDISGTLPMLRLTDIPWDQALDIILKQNQMRGELQGNVLRIARVSTLQAEEAGRKAQLDAKDATSELVTHTYILNYTTAAAVATTLAKSVSKRGEILQDVRKNALIITDIPSQFSKVDQMVKFLDTPAQQVEIAARLVSADKSFSRDLGSQLGLLIGKNNIVSGASGTASPLTRPGGASPLPLFSNLPAGANSGIGFLLQPGGGVFLDEILTAAESSGQAKLLSAPRITTQNNIAATVSKGTQIPVQTSVNNTVSVSFINFALNLSVTPQIADNGMILLTIQLENSVPDFARSVNGIPSVATQQAKTQVLIPDGGTAVIGGIYIDTDSLNTRQVPGLGSLPVIGHLFKETSTIKSTSELIFFVTPKIKPMDQIAVTTPELKDGLPK